MCRPRTHTEPGSDKLTLEVGMMNPASWMHACPSFKLIELVAKGMSFRQDAGILQIQTMD
jgi:hypothetical protein